MSEVERLQLILDSGKWPSGMAVMEYERPVIAHNIELAKAKR